MNRQAQTSELALASQLGKWLRDYFGRGPQSIYVNMKRPYVVVYLRNFLTPIEKMLLQEEQEFLFQQTRDIIMNQYLIPQIKSYVRDTLGTEIREFYYDWGLHNDAGVLTWIEEGGGDGAVPEDSYDGQDELHREMQSLFEMPELARLCSWLINSRTLLMIRTGIVLELEKELVRLGNAPLLKLAKRNVDKRLLYGNPNIGRILNHDVSEIFVDCNLALGKSIWVFMLKAKS